MKREIGSDFWDVPIIENTNTIFPLCTQWFLSGRSALSAIIKELDDCHTVAIPSWCCESVIKPFYDAGFEVRFYPVYYQKELIQEICCDCDVLFIMDYFGYTASQPQLSEYKGVVIRDLTHSIFSTIYADADYYFGSLRKWVGVWTGGFAWTKDGHELTNGKESDNGYVFLRRKAMQQKAEYIRGYRKDKNYLNIFRDAEDALEHVGIASAIDRDIEKAIKMDVEFIRSRRRANAEVLRNAFSESLIFSKLSPIDTPMFVPILVPNGKRDELRSYLIEHDIYCPIHWRVSEYHKMDYRTLAIYNNELSLVCDQRYTEENMCRMIETIKTFMEV